MIFAQKPFLIFRGRGRVGGRERGRGRVGEKEREKRERERERDREGERDYNKSLIMEVTYCYFCHVLLVTQSTLV